jgi:hypothetical protein
MRRGGEMVDGEIRLAFSLTLRPDVRILRKQGSSNLHLFGRSPSE